MPSDARTILATSGGYRYGRRTQLEFDALVHHAVELSGVHGRRPRLTFVGTAPHDLTKNALPAHLSLSLGVYLPAALLLLRHPNVGELPPLLERASSRLPRWARGVRPNATSAES